MGDDKARASPSIGISLTETSGRKEAFSSLSRETTRQAASMVQEINMKTTLTATEQQHSIRDNRRGQPISIPHE